MVTKKIVRNEKGFTLIEIIAVLIILGILAAVAVPKFMDMQVESQNKAMTGGLAAAASQATMNFSADILSSNGACTAANWVPSPADVPLGDFCANISNSDGEITVSLTSGPTWFSGNNTGSKTKTFKLN